MTLHADIRFHVAAIVGHLGRARTQRAPSDDRIIAELIDTAHDHATTALALLVRAAEAPCDWANQPLVIGGQCQRCGGWWTRDCPLQPRQCERPCR